MAEPKRGMSFAHARVIDPADYHLPAAQARKALMRITAVRRGAVYYTFAGEPDNTRAMAYMPLADWIANYS
jgi:hypothetical protein